MAGFTQEQYEKASQVELMDYLISNGYNIKKVGTNEYTLEEHDSMRINPLKNNFFWNSRNVGGSTIQFLQYYEGKSFVDAVKILSGEQVSTTITNRPQYTPKIEEKGELILPEKNEDNKRAISYLTNTRKLDFEIVNSLIKSGNIYESKDKHNVVFLGKDSENNVKYAMQRSTLTESNYKGDCKNSDKDYGFRINSQSSCDKVCVFESAIDLITHATISKHLGKNWKDINRVSLGCLSFKSMDSFLKDNTNIKEINLFLDNDESGQENAQKFYNQYKDDYKINIIQVKSKDLNQTWQDYLKDKELNNNIKISGYLKCLNSPFVLPKKLENSNLKQYLKDMLDDFKQNEMIKNIESIFQNEVIFESEDNKAILVCKDEQGENIGGYKWDIYSKSENLILIPNSNMSKKQQDDISGFAKNIYSQVYKALEIQEETSLEM